MDVSVPRKEKMLVGMVPCAGGGGGRQMCEKVVGMSDGAMRKRGQGREQDVMALGALCMGGDISPSIKKHCSAQGAQAHGLTPKGAGRWGIGVAIRHQAAVVLATSSC